MKEGEKIVVKSKFVKNKTKTTGSTGSGGFLLAKPPTGKIPLLTKPISTPIPTPVEESDTLDDDDFDDFVSA